MNNQIGKSPDVPLLDEINPNHDTGSFFKYFVPNNMKKFHIGLFILFLIVAGGILYYIYYNKGKEVKENDNILGENTSDLLIDDDTDMAELEKNITNKLHDIDDENIEEENKDGENIEEDDEDDDDNNDQKLFEEEYSSSVSD